MQREALTRDLPTASSLPRLRDFVAAVAAGHDASMRVAGLAAGLSERHAAYYGLAASDTLRLVVRAGDGRLALTPLARELLATPRESHAERAVFRRAIADSPSITSIAPDLLDAEGPTAEALTHRLVHASLAANTAKRRASALLSWRRYALEPQGALPL